MTTLRYLRAAADEGVSIAGMSPLTVQAMTAAIETAEGHPDPGELERLVSTLETKWAIDVR